MSTEIGNCLVTLTSTPRSSSAFLAYHKTQFIAFIDHCEKAESYFLNLTILARLCISPQLEVSKLALQALTKRCKSDSEARSFLRTLEVPSGSTDSWSELVPFAERLCSTLAEHVSEMKSLFTESSPSDGTISALSTTLPSESPLLSGNTVLELLCEELSLLHSLILNTSQSFILVKDDFVPLFKSNIVFCLDLLEHEKTESNCPQSDRTALLNNILDCSWKCAAACVCQTSLRTIVGSTFSGDPQLCSLLGRTCCHSSPTHYSHIKMIISIADNLPCLIPHLLEENLVGRVIDICQPTTIPITYVAFHLRLIRTLIILIERQREVIDQEMESKRIRILLLERVLQPAQQYLQFVLQQEPFIPNLSRRINFQTNVISNLLRQTLALERDLFEDGEIVETGREEWEVGWLVEKTMEEALEVRLEMIREDDVRMKKNEKERWKKRVDRLREAGHEDALEGNTKWRHKKTKKGFRLDTSRRVMISFSLLICLFQHILGTTANEVQPNTVIVHLNSKASPQDLTSVLGHESSTNGFKSNKIEVLSIKEGTYIGGDIEITHRSLELSGEWFSQRNEPGSRLIPSCGSKRTETEDPSDMHTANRCLFSLANSTLWLKWIRFSVVATSAEAGTPRIAIISNSMLSISDSVVELSPSTSPILISSSMIDESAAESSVVVRKCSISSERGQMCGFVETSAFPSFEEPVSVSIIGCSFDSSWILGKDGIGLSLTQPPRQSEQFIGTISSSLIDCSFVNMSSIGSSHQPHLPHLSQKMLGCVVSLTSSHLSGSTIRDLNKGGSVLCSNSSFSSLLSSSDTNPSRGTVTISDGSPEEFVDGKLYEIDGTSAIFSNCHFTRAVYDTYYELFWSPIYIWSSPNTVSILSCTFTNLYSTDPYEGSDAIYGTGGAAHINSHYHRNCVSIIVTSSNFTNCSAPNCGGGLFIRVVGDVVVDSCRFGNCSEGVKPLHWSVGGRGGGIFVSGSLSGYKDPTLQFDLVGCVFSDCVVEQGGGVMVEWGDVDVFVVDTKFEHCAANFRTGSSKGGGMAVDTDGAMTMERCQFIGCSSPLIGGALYCYVLKNVTISDTLVQGCFSGTSGAVYNLLGNNMTHSLSYLVFDGNRIGGNASSISNDIPDGKGKDIPIDLSIDITSYHGYLHPYTFDDCFTTVSPNSAGIVGSNGWKIYEVYFDYLTGERYYVDYAQIGPYLTDCTAARVNEKTGLIELELKAKTPLMSQEYEVTVRENGTKTETTFRMLFMNGTGTLVSPSEAALQYGSTYTITSIVGVVPISSSSAITNDNSVPVLPYAFSFYDNERHRGIQYHVFDTPSIPSFSTLQDATAHLIESDPQAAFVVLHFDKEVWGSYEFVVEEEGKDVTLVINTEISSKSGATKEFKVIGDGKLLTHDTTYTIKSIVRDPESDSLFVRMNETITFHIPKSPYVPPEEPEPEEPTEPEPEDPKDKKAMSPEMKSLLSWLVPLVACLLIALLVAIVVIVLLRRRQKKNAEPAQKELEVQEPFDVEKVEEFGVDCSNGVIHTDGMSHSAFNSSSDRLPTNTNRSRDEGKAQTEGEWVEVMACSGGFEISVVPMGDTLYSVLHKEHREVGKRGVGMQIVNGLKQVVTHRGWSDVLTRLSSHWILIDAGGNVQLKLQMNTSEAEQEAAQAQTQNAQALPNLEGNENEQTDKSGMDGLRWRAPEVVASKGGQVDGHKASVFSLGLVLWEIETGQVPFGELDAVNAQRQSGTGIGPKMESLPNEDFISLIRRCVSVDPEQRPTLTEVGEFLSSHPDETIRASRNELKE
ncbi:hypothetical protein BLNAU_5869 [Blattamonas nauphoetae]|uniref:Protein kinase domain-containing protein n=1 Tax=Blattamonas nauphoetae TaxID=2049346 RepID=A0ABQ9Y5U3_9EUKA|nr:hypothetical protein BLNAU_5869 [Blattamonas nauphoetae]